MIHGLKALVAAMLLALAGCSATGHNFDSSQLSSLTPGQTTMAQAVYVLNAPPDKVYPQSDGTTLAFWQYHATIVTDGLYGHKEALLQFGPDGRLMRLVDGTNLLLESWERRKLLGAAPPPAPRLAPAMASGDVSDPQAYAVPGPVPGPVSGPVPAPVLIPVPDAPPPVR